MAVIHTDSDAAGRGDFGRRQPLWGRYIAFGEKLVYSGPIFRQATVEGGRMRVWFLGTDGGGRTENTLQGFEVAGEDRCFFPADAQIEGNSVFLSSPSVPRPVRVRYAWATNPNLPGLPAREAFSARPCAEGN
jgi:sialate O-acetylesterase